MQKIETCLKCDSFLNVKTKVKQRAYPTGMHAVFQYKINFMYLILKTKI